MSTSEMGRFDWGSIFSMNAFCRSAIILALLLFSISTASSAHMASTGLSDKGGEPLLQVPGIDPESLLLRDKSQTMVFDKVLQFAEPFVVDASCDTYGQWDLLSDNQVVWRLFVNAPGATDVNIGFTEIYLPEGCALYLTATEEGYQTGPYTHHDNTEYRQLWTPVLPGAYIMIEAEMPLDVVDAFTLAIGQVNSGYRDLFRTGFAGMEKQGWCNNDVVCPIADGWRDEIRSVARYSFSGTSLCTGSLVMNQRADFTPYFLTANHCVSTAAAAASVVVYWNYESPTCGALSGGSLSQNQSGSTLRATHSASDFSLLELSAMPDGAFNVYYAGWDRSGNGVDASVCIHHPSGDEKAISFDYSPLQSTAYLSDTVNPGANHWRVVDWGSGTTEPGSSGSGLWNESTRRIVGQLHGGYAACGNDLSDWYGKFSVSWTGGGTAATRLSDWLDPDGAGVTGMNGGDPAGLSRVYVDRAATSGAQTGDSWADAYLTIQEGINDPNAPSGGVWVMQGHYVVSAPVTLPSGVELYGGFSGLETAPEERDLLAHETMIDGNSGVYHVVLLDTVVNTRLDGVTITGGNANGASFPDNGGGGIACLYVGDSNTISNCIIRNNTAIFGGGGIGGAYSAPILSHVTIMENTVFCIDYGGGGGMAIALDSAPTLIHCLFKDNQAIGTPGSFNVSGGGLGVNDDCDPTLTNCVFIGNTAYHEGGGLSNGSGTNTVMTNCTFYGNTCGTGGGAFRDWAGTATSATNCIFWGNTPNEIQSSTAVVTYSNIQGGYGAPGDNNINADPLFVNAAAGNLQLTLGSPCIGAANTAAAPAVDFIGTPRPQGDNADMGAYEYIFDVSGITITPATTFVVAGPAGGPFTPDEIVYTLVNDSAASLEWTAALDAGLVWGELSKEGGVLGVGASDTVTLSLNDAVASGLAPGIYAGSVIFTNVTLALAEPRLARLEARPMDHLVWDTVHSPQIANLPFTTTLRAVDGMGEVVTTYTGPVTLEGRTDGSRQTGAGAANWIYPLSTFYHDARTQVIYLQSELGAAALFEGLALDVTTMPGQTLDNWTIRMKHTGMDVHASASWEGPTSGWTTVFQSNTTISTTGWVWFDFSTPFAYDGASNLMIDFSFNNSHYTTDGNVRYTVGASGRSLSYRTDSSFGDPLTWSGTTNPAPVSSSNVPNIQLRFGGLVSIQPLASGAFTGGVWTGQVTVMEEASQMILRALEGTFTGDSNRFDVLATAMDFGDAPEPYPTLLVDDGARHVVGPLYLGALIDAESDGQPHPDALGDDLNGLADEDGVVFITPLLVGQEVTVEVTASLPGKLDAWIDFAGNGDWNDPEDQIFASYDLVAGAQAISFTVPTTAAPTVKTYARFRLSGAGGLTPVGLADDGEVEDYTVGIGLGAPVLEPEPAETPGISNTVSWSAIPGAAAYYVEMDTDPGFPGPVANSGWIAGLSHEFTGLTHGEIYHYRVKARSQEFGIMGDWTQSTQVEFETDTLTDVIAAPSDAVILAGVGSTVDTVGGTLSSWSGDNRGRLNGYLVSSSTLLTKIEVYLDIASSTAIEFVVYEGGATFTVPFTRVHSSLLASSGTGVGYYSSDAINVPLTAGNHYLIGAYWSGSTTYYRDGYASTAFGTFVGNAQPGGYPSPATFTDTLYSLPQYAFRLTSGTGYADSGTAVTPIIAPSPFQAWDAVHFNAATPADTTLTVDILPETGDTPIPGYADVASGVDISGVTDIAIRLRANLATADEEVTPALHDWSVTWLASTDFIESDYSAVEWSEQNTTPEVTEWPTASDIVYGQTLADAMLSDGVASTPGMFAFTDDAIAPNAGTAMHSVTFTPDDLVNFTEVLGEVSVTVHQVIPIVTEWPTASDIVYGQTLADAMLSDGTASTPGMFAFTDDAIAPNAGTAMHSVTFTPDDLVNFTEVLGEVSVTVHQAAPNVTEWPTASDIVEGQMLSDSLLSGGVVDVVGEFAFTVGSILPGLGVYNASVTFFPEDSANYLTVLGHVDVNVLSAVEGEGEGEGEFSLTYTGPNPVTASEGDRVEITVMVQNSLGAVTYQWYLVTPDKALTTLPDENDSTLTFDPVTIVDEGDYQCEATDTLGGAALSPVITLLVTTGLSASGMLMLAALGAAIGLYGFAASRRR